MAKAGLPDLDTSMPDRAIKAPRKPQFSRHAEEVIINKFDYQVKKAGLDPSNVRGNLVIHQSNPRGVCTACIQGINNPDVDPGIFFAIITTISESKHNSIN